MSNKSLIFTILLVAAILLTACQPAIPLTALPSTPIGAVSPELSPTIPPEATRTPVSPSPTPTLIPTQVAGPLAIVSYQMQESPELEPVLFTSVQGRKFDSQDFSLGDTLFPDLSFSDNHASCLKNELDGSPLVACQYYNKDGTQSFVNLTLNGSEIYTIDTGTPYPSSTLQGLWIYDQHWVLETVHITTTTSGNVTTAALVGQITVDGVLLNDRQKYDEAFSFQTFGGKPFFLFKRDEKVGFSYDGVETPLGYDEVPHYGCCVAAALNPQVWQNHVNFFGQRGDTWFFVTISDSVFYNNIAEPSSSASGLEGWTPSAGEITVADSGRTIDFGLTSRFSIVLKESEYPIAALELNCIPEVVMGRISNVEAVPQDYYVLRYEGTGIGQCTIQNGGFEVTINIIDHP